MFTFAITGMSMCSFRAVSLLCSAPRGRLVILSHPPPPPIQSTSEWEFYPQNGVVRPYRIIPSPIPPTPKHERRKQTTTTTHTRGVSILNSVEDSREPSAERESLNCCGTTRTILEGNDSPAKEWAPFCLFGIMYGIKGDLTTPGHERQIFIIRTGTQVQVVSNDRMRMILQLQCLIDLPTHPIECAI